MDDFHDGQPRGTVLSTSRVQVNAANAQDVGEIMSFSCSLDGL